jgi:hypothetical protein
LYPEPLREVFGDIPHQMGVIPLVRAFLAVLMDFLGG